MIGDFDDIFARLKGKLPSRWFGGTADTLPVFDGVLAGLATLLSFAYAVYSYARLQTRIMTATDGWLDMIAADFFGPNQVRRITGQGDTSYRLVILANLFREKGTRPAIRNILVALTGQEPTIIEPTRPGDTGAYGSIKRASLVGASVYQTDWQGHQRLYPTARTNLITSANAAAMNALTGGWASSPSGLSQGVVADGSERVNVSSAGYFTKFFSFEAGRTYALSVVFSSPLQDASGFILANSAAVGNYGVSVNTVTGVATVYQGPSAGVVASNYVTAAGNGYRLTLVFQCTTSGSYQLRIGVQNAAQATISAPQLEVAIATGVLIPTNTTSVTVTDIGFSDGGVISLAKPPPSSAVLSVISPQDGILVEQTIGNGDGFRTSFIVSLPSGPYSPIGYGSAGSYGSMLLPYQAFVIAYRPLGGDGLANAAGYGVSSGGYGQPSRAEYAALADSTGAITDADIFAVVDAVKPAGTIVWVRIDNKNG